MKNITSITTLFAVFLSVIFGFFAISVPVAFANPSFGSGTYETFRTANYTDNPGSINWYDEGYDYASAEPGDTVAFSIYFENTGSTTAYGVRLHASPRTSSAKTSHSFYAEVRSSNGAFSSGSVEVETRDNSAQSLDFVSGSATLLNEYPTNISSISIQGTESQIFNGNGLLVGDVPPGYSAFLRFHMKVSNNQPPQPITPTIITGGSSSVTQTSAVVYGTVNGNGAGTLTYFEYSTSLSQLRSGAGTRTPSLNRGSGAVSNFPQTLTNLQPGTTYYYQACAENTFNIVVCDPEEQFVTLGNVVPPTATLDITTNSATSITDNSATLRGEVVGGQNVTAWFVLSIGSNPSCTDTSIRYSVSGTYSALDTFSTNVSNLNDNTTYYYRACGEISGGVTDSGSILSFTTQDNSGPTNNLEVRTNSADSIDEDSAVLNGEYENADDGDVFFVWGDDEDEVDDAVRENSRGNINQDVEIEIMQFNANGDDLNVDVRIDDLDEDTRYYFALCVEQDNDLICGAVRDFETDGDSDDDFDPTTDDADNIDSDSATLNGDYQDADNTDIFFVWSDDRSEVEDAEDEETIDDVEDLDVEVEVVERGADGDDNSVSETISGLRDDTTYYFALCGETEDEEIVCGSVRSFRTGDSDFNPSSNLPVVSACSAVGVGITNATLNAFYEGSQNTEIYYEYGTTTALGLRSSTRSFLAGSGSVPIVVSGLAPNTQYYCRVVAKASAGTAFGDLGTFRTSALPVIPSVSPTTTVRVVSQGGSGDLVTLEIDDNQELVTRGQIAQYIIEYSNNSGRDLDQVAIYVTLPQTARFVSSTRGVYNRRDHAVYYSIGELKKDESDDFSITVRISGGRDGEPLVAQAVLAFEDPADGEDALLNAIEFDSNQYSSGYGLTAGLFGIGLPATLLGWIFFFFILLMIALLVRYLYYWDRERRYSRYLREREEEAYWRERSEEARYRADQSRKNEPSAPDNLPS